MLKNTLRKIVSFVEKTANNHDNSYTFPAHYLKHNLGAYFAFVPFGLMMMHMSLDKSQNKLAIVADVLVLLLCGVATALCGLLYAIFMLVVVSADVVVGKYICYRPYFVYNDDENAV